LKSLVINGKERFLGNKTPMASDTKHWKAKGVYGDSPNQPMIPRSQWRPYTMRKWVPEILDQDGIGACNAFCTVMTLHGTRSRQGLPYRCLSAGWLYGNINGQRDDGSNLEDALQWMTTKGTPYATTVGMLDWRKSSWPRGKEVEEEARLNVFLEAYWCPTFDHLASAILSGYWCNTGLWWGDDEPDSNGWLAGSARGRRGGHSVPGIGLHPKPGTTNVWGTETANSWGTDFGDRGFCKIPESRFTSDGMSSGMWAVVAAVVQPPDDLPDLAAKAEGKESALEQA